MNLYYVAAIVLVLIALAVIWWIWYGVKVMDIDGPRYTFDQKQAERDCKELLRSASRTPKHKRAF